MTLCTRCDGVGFLNTEQLPFDAFEVGTDAVLVWMKTDAGIESDVQICDCCGDGVGWYGAPGSHYGPDDPPGPGGPYASNGGLCQCH